MYILIGGKKQSGKSTTSAMIKELSLISFQEEMFSRKLKEMACKLLDCSMEDLESEEFKEVEAFAGVTVRQVLQKLGTDFGRDLIGKDIWVDAVLNNYVYGENLIISDVRFINELNLLNNVPGFSIYVMNSSSSTDPHKSENSLTKDNFDYVISNTGTLKELEDKIKIILKKENLL